MGEVAADDKEVVVVEIGAEEFCCLFQFVEVVSGDDYRHDGRHIAQSPLQEWQLHLQAVLTLVGFFLVVEHLFLLVEHLCGFFVHFHIAQRCGIKVVGAVG